MKYSRTPPCVRNNDQCTRVGLGNQPTIRWKVKGCVRRRPFFLVTIICRYQITTRAYVGHRAQAGFANATDKCRRNKILLPNNIRAREFVAIEFPDRFRNAPAVLPELPIPLFAPFYREYTRISTVDTTVRLFHPLFFYPFLQK